MKAIIASLSFFLILHTFANSKVDKIDELVTYCEENGLFNGTVLVAEQGKIIYSKLIGKADIDNDIPLTASTPFALASITKQFTAMGIMILAEKGKLNYSDTLGKLLPELPEYCHPVTIKNLLQHTSGLKRDYPGNTNEEAFQKLLEEKEGKLSYKPGTKMRYCNTGYLLLAHIIEKISKKSYEDFMIEHIFGPLKMTNTFVFNDSLDCNRERAIGYDGLGKKSDYNTFTYGSTGIYSTAEDLFKWCQTFTTDQIIPFELKKEAYKPAISNSGKLLDNYSGENKRSFGFGLFTYTNKLDGIVGHGGVFYGFRNVMFKDLKNNREVIVLTNNGEHFPFFGFGNAINYILRNEPYQYPKIPIDLEIRMKHYKDIDNAIIQYAHLKKNNFDKYQFNEEEHLNRLGYALIADKRIDDAIKIFKLFVSEFPESANAHDSLGEAYYENKQYSLSLQNYEKALNINPDFFNAEGAKEMVNKNKEKLMEKKVKVK